MSHKSNHAVETYHELLEVYETLAECMARRSMYNKDIRNLRMRAARLQRGEMFNNHPVRTKATIRINGNFEWCEFATVIIYGIKLKGTGWQLFGGSKKKTPMFNPVFTFSMKTNSYSHLINFDPHLEINKRAKRIRCYDLLTALELMKFRYPFKQVKYEYRMSKYSATRIGICKNLESLRIGRFTGGEHGGTTQVGTGGHLQHSDNSEA